MKHTWIVENTSMIPWDQLHGVLTHFPIALLLFSTARDFAALGARKLALARELGTVSFYSLIAAAVASLGAAASGIALAQG
jgi:uncharacterized membrane protein